MQSDVHFWIVCDAIHYMENFGTPDEQDAVFRLQKPYGNVAEQLADYYNGYLQRTAGAEAINVDHYHDLLAYAPFPVMNTYGENSGEWVTCLNHYENAFLVPGPWRGAFGYFYPWSSCTSKDAEFRDWRLSALHVNIEDNSLALGRLRHYWHDTEAAWVENWERVLYNSIYAPCSALAATYYQHLIEHYGDLMHVSVYGNRPDICGLEKLGPVLHFIGDVAVPQHIRGAHGFCHTEWEDTVRTLAYNRDIDLDPNLVRDLLSAEPFHPDYAFNDGVRDRYPVDLIISRLAAKTRDKIMQSTNMSLVQLWNAGDPFWTSYYVISTMAAAAHVPNNDMNYFYNLAVAGVVHTLRRTWEELHAVGELPWAGLEVDLITGFPTTPNARERNRAVRARAEEPTAYNYLRQPALQRVDHGGLRPEERRANSLADARSLLGFDPTSAGRDAAQLSHRLSELDRMFDVASIHDLDVNRIAQLLPTIQASMEEEFVGQVRMGAVSIEGLRRQIADQAARFGSSFGIYAFRPPTIAECVNEVSLRQYLNRSEVHKYHAFLLDLTSGLAALSVERNQSRDRVEEARRSLEILRDQAIQTRAIPSEEGQVTADHLNLVDPQQPIIPATVYLIGQ